MNHELWKDGISTLLRLAKIANRNGEPKVALAILKTAVLAQDGSVWQ